MWANVQRGVRWEHSIPRLNRGGRAMQAEAKVSPRGSQTQGLDGLESIFLAAAVVWLCAMLVTF